MNRHLNPPGRAKQAIGLVVSFAAAFAVAAIGSVATADSVTGWYRTLEKPAFNPPDAVFAPVWTLLYAMMAIAAWRVWRRRSPEGGRALSLYGVQLILNLGWTLLFFGLHSPLLALVDIAALIVVLVLTIVAFHRIDRPAAVLLLPYLAWTLFASALNFAIWRLN